MLHEPGGGVPPLAAEVLGDRAGVLRTLAQTAGGVGGAIVDLAAGPLTRLLTDVGRGLLGGVGAGAELVLQVLRRGVGGWG